MNQEQKQRVEMLCVALESGEYEQGFGTLHAVDSDGRHTWCCIGVGGDVADKNDCPVERHLEAHYFRNQVEDIDGHTDYFSPRLMDWYGFTDQDPVIDLGNRKVHASHANDMGIPFPEIAAAFRREYLDGE